MRTMARNERKTAAKKFFEILRSADRESKASSSLQAVNERTRFVARQLLKAFKPNTIVAWRTFLVPSEIFYATGVLPFTPESTCAVIAQNQAATMQLIGKAEEHRYDAKLCSFLKNIVGGVFEDVMPAPDLVVGSPCFCASIGSILEAVAQYYDSKFFYLNIPLHSTSQGDIEYVAAQLRELVKLCCDISGLDLAFVEQETLPGAIENSNQAQRYWKQIEQLRQAVPSPLSGKEALDYATVLSQMWGSEDLVKIFKLLHSEIQERVANKSAAVPNELFRIFWLHLRPYYSVEMLDFLESQGAVVVFEDVNYPSRYQINASKPYLSLAREILANAGQYRTFSSKWRDDLAYVVGNFSIDGIIHFNHDNCEWTKNTFPGVSHYLQQERKVPLLSLSGDCLIKGREELFKTRIQAFLEGLAAKKATSPAQIVSRTNNFTAGLDIGAVTTKAVILSQGKIIGWKVLPTGADNRNTAMQALREAIELAGLQQENCGSIVATGVGRNNIPIANSYPSEITCHTEGMLYFFSEAETIIDIGGQDTKAILVKEKVFRMNDRCAAGTGKFLENIARALGLELEQLAELDAEAKQALMISRMCATFAESEVIDLIAQGARLEDIVRGMHEAVADRAISLARQLSSNIPMPLAMSGGVAMNQGVVRAIERRLGTKILVPNNPQIIGALGAAIIASKK